MDIKNKSLNRTTMIKYYERACQNFIDMSTKDPAAAIAKEHGLIGLTRILICMNKLGIQDANCHILALPDLTFTRSYNRWNSGFPYGCIISIESKETPFIPLDFKPNCCGVLFAKIPEINKDIHVIRNDFYAVMRSYNIFNESDFKRGNHFMGIYENENDHYVLLHGSLNFVKSQLYSNRNDQLMKQMGSMEILDIPFNYLAGDVARQYYQDYLNYQQMTIKYRELLVKGIFPNAEIMFNGTHEGFMDINTILLGGYASLNPFSCPIMLSPGSDLNIMHVTEPSIVANRVIYCAPHGGGYALNEVINAKKYEQTASDADFLLSFKNGMQMLSDEIQALPYHYRTNTADCWCHDYGKASIQKRLRPIMNIKI